MLLNTEGIVLNAIKYGETSLISKVYTKEKGLISIILSSTKKDKKRLYFQALSSINAVLYIKNNKNVHRLKEVSFNGDYVSNKQDVAVDAIRFFLAELLTIIIKEEEYNPQLYEFLSKKIKLLNHPQSTLSNFHIDFLFDFLAFMGVAADFNQKGNYFDLEESHFTNHKPQHNSYLSEHECNAIRSYLSDQSLKKQQKKIVLNAILKYYSAQVDGVKKLKSRAVLETVFA